jgi:hypothetical protein
MTATKLVTFLAAGVFGLTAAAHAGTLIAPDPNLAPTTVEQAQVFGAGSNGVLLAAPPDPNLGPSTVLVEVALPATRAGAPQLAAAPDPNLDTPSVNVVAKTGKMVAGSGAHASALAQTIAQ